MGRWGWGAGLGVGRGLGNELGGVRCRGDAGMAGGADMGLLGRTLGLTVPCPQLACGPDGQPLGFAVLEFDSADAAERVQAAMDGALVGSSRVCVSFCAPGLPGHKMLPALVAVRTAVRPCGAPLHAHRKL